MSVLLVGSEGSMGKRYQAILKYLNVPFWRVEKDWTDLSIKCAPLVEKIIVATPTDTHVSVIKDLLPYRKPILCEKPITKNIDQLRNLLGACDQYGVKLRMMFQYGQLVNNDASELRSYYDYFRHGNDGLIWDCMQIIALANGDVTLSENSPVWKCSINGVALVASNMDRAYVDEVREFILGSSSNHQSPEWLLGVHEKVAAYEKAHNG